MQYMSASLGRYGVALAKVRSKQSMALADHIINLSAKGEVLIQGNTKLVDCSLCADRAIVQHKVKIIWNSFTYCFKYDELSLS